MSAQVNRNFDYCSFVIVFFIEVEDNKTQGGSGHRYFDNTYRPVKQLSPTRNHIAYDAAGNKRIQPIRLSNGLKGSRPNALPHTKVCCFGSELK